MFKFLLLVNSILFMSTIASAKEVPIDIRINGEYIITDQEPVIIDGTTYSPIRAVAEALNASRVTWNEDNLSANISLNGTETKLTVNSNISYVNGEKVEILNAPFIKNDRIYVPIRFLSEICDNDVSWDDTYKNVEIINHNSTVRRENIDTSFNHDDLYWMSKIIHAESEGEPFEGQVAVGDVVINRVNSFEFPNTIYDVIFDKKYGVQFEPILNGSIYKTPNSRAISAAKHSLTSPSTVGSCLYFFNPTIASSNWISKNREYSFTIGGHDFYL